MARFLSKSSVSGKEEFSLSPPMRGSSVMVVDDNQGDAELLRIWLARLGCRVRVASDGEECIQLYEEDHFEFILMDLDMPFVDGREATKKIREIESRRLDRKAVIIAVTGLEDENLQTQCVADGMDGYFCKPFSPKEIVQALSSLIASWYGRGDAKLLKPDGSRSLKG